MTVERLKQELVQVSNAYAESFNRQDAAGIAALFVDGGVHVNEAGPRNDIEHSTGPRSRQDHLIAWTPASTRFGL